MFRVHTITNQSLIDFYPDRFMPMMISRMIISLKKVAAKQRSNVDVEIPTGLPTTNTGYTSSSHPTGDIQLAVLKK